MPADGNLHPAHRPRFWSGNTWTYGNPDVPNVAARYVAKAMTRVAPQQREELLNHIIRQASEALAVIQRGEAA